MDRIRRLSVNQATTEFFKCLACTGDVAVSADEICDFCWYDFEATEEERRSVNESNIFRELSVHQWYTKLHVTKLSLSLLSPISIMHILHDCFRLSPARSDIGTCLQRATNIFSESVPWLRRLLRGALPIVLQPTSTERIYKFAAGIGRTPIWYKITKSESSAVSKWSWTPYNPVADSANTAWLPCPQLLVSVGKYVNQVPVAENIFIIMFLHTFRPDQPAENMETKLDSNHTITNHIREDVLKSLLNFTLRTSKT